MDITSYLLGKNASSGGGGGSVDEYFQQDLTAVTQISSPVVKYINKKIPTLTLNSSITATTSFFAYCTYLETAPMMNTENITAMNGMFQYCGSLKEVPKYNTSKVTDMSSMFERCGVLETVPQFDTSKVTTFYNTFVYCNELKNVPVLDFSSVTTFTYMFRNCTKLSNDSINNILASCITATSFTGQKKLTSLGLSTSYYPVNMIQGLSNYQAFINAGWTIS